MHDTIVLSIVTHRIKVAKKQYHWYWEKNQRQNIASNLLTKAKRSNFNPVLAAVVVLERLWAWFCGCGRGPNLLRAFGAQPSHPLDKVWINPCTKNKTHVCEPMESKHTNCTNRVKSLFSAEHYLLNLSSCNYLLHTKILPLLYMNIATSIRM